MHHAKVHSQTLGQKETRPLPLTAWKGQNWYCLKKKDRFIFFFYQYLDQWTMIKNLTSDKKVNIWRREAEVMTVWLVGLSDWFGSIGWLVINFVGRLVGWLVQSVDWLFRLLVGLSIFLIVGWLRNAARWRLFGRLMRTDTGERSHGQGKNRGFGLFDCSSFATNLLSL